MCVPLRVLSEYTSHTLGSFLELDPLGRSFRGSFQYISVNSAFLIAQSSILSGSESFAQLEVYRRRKAVDHLRPGSICQPEVSDARRKVAPSGSRLNINTRVDFTKIVSLIFEGLPNAHIMVLVKTGGG